MEVLVETQGYIYDISDMCTDVSWSDVLNGGASSLDISYIRNGLTLQNGDVIRLTDNDQADGIFLARYSRYPGTKAESLRLKRMTSCAMRSIRTSWSWKTGRLRTWPSICAPSCR